MEIVNWKEIDATQYDIVSWHNSLLAAQKKAKKANSQLIVHYPETIMKLEHWVVLTPKKG